MKPRPILFLVGGLLLGVGMGLLVLVSGGSPNPPSPQPGKTPPDFQLKDLQGMTMTLTQQRGKPLLINFWATWCIPCKAELPLLADYAKKTAGRMVFLGIDAQEDAAAVSQFVKEYVVSYPILIDTNGQTIKDYQIRGFPTTMFIDGQGILQKIHIGQLTEQDLIGYLGSVGVIP
jgi:cytochrome c biogenesis protein CcmG, thiol:disulfide interchange protein DsbE